MNIINSLERTQDFWKQQNLRSTHDIKPFNNLQLQVSYPADHHKLREEIVPVSSTIVFGTKPMDPSEFLTHHHWRLSRRT